MQDDVQHPKSGGVPFLEGPALSSEMRGEIRDVSDRVSSTGPPHPSPSHPISSSPLPVTLPSPPGGSPDATDG
tara:strand:- start:738 stop:956 length:219 start_codon:yes stop_codon:yes gene_type:complete